jgi:hypothetical protein
MDAEARAAGMSWAELEGVREPSALAERGCGPMFHDTTSILIVFQAIPSPLPVLSSPLPVVYSIKIVQGEQN